MERLDEEGREKVIVFLLNEMLRAGMRRQRSLNSIIQVLHRRRRLYEQQRQILILQNSFIMKQNILNTIQCLSVRESGDRRIWSLPRPQHWFDQLLMRRDLDNEWPRHFRVNRNTFEMLVEIARPSMTTKDRNFRTATKVEKKVAAALWRLATGNAYRCIGIALGIGTSCAQRYTRQFCRLLYEKRNDYIRFPRNLTSVIQEFSKRTKIPNVTGAIDGSHIPIKAPSVDQESYFNRKHRHSILVQGVVGPNLLFFDAFVGVPGSVHDSRLLRLSNFGKNMESKKILQNPEFSIEKDVVVKPLILGDSAYKIKTWLLPPYTRLDNMSQSKIKFNREHCMGREVVERAYGHLKGRWQILLTEQTERIEQIHITVMVCMILHNICILHGDNTNIEEPYEIALEDEEMEDSRNGEGNENEPNGELIRDIIADNIDRL